MGFALQPPEQPEPDDGSSFVRFIGWAFVVLLTFGAFFAASAALIEMRRAIQRAAEGL